MKTIHFNSKAAYENFERSSMMEIHGADLVSYTTKKGNVKIKKSRYTKQGKFTKAEFKRILIDIYDNHVFASPILEGIKPGEMGCVVAKAAHGTSRV